MELNHNNMKAYITKYALTKGIIEKEVSVLSLHMVRVTDNPYEEYYHGSEWHETLDQARTTACRMRDEKIASMRKKLAKLEKMIF